MKTFDQRNRAQRALVNTPLVNVPKLAAKLDSSDKLDISRAMENDAERLILLGEYLNALANGQDHAGAHRYASRKVAKVRRAMGYSYPKQGLANVTW